MLTLQVRLDLDLFDAVRAAAESAGDPGDLAAALREVVHASPAFGSEQPWIAARPEEWFALDRMSAAGFWEGQQRLRRYIEERLDDSVAAVAPYLPPVGDDRPLVLTVHPVPGFGSCYGAADGRQVFGLYDGADSREMLLFLSHTYYHEISSALDTAASRRAAADPTSVPAFRHWLLLLIRNEGVANYAVLRQLRELRDSGIGFAYFKYAELIDNRSATAKAMLACRELLQRLDDRSVRHLVARVSAILKNPRLPVINLVGIHIADAIAARYGEAVLLDVDGREPQEFFRLYADSQDPLLEALLGAGREALPAFGLGEQAPIAQGSP